LTNKIALTFILCFIAVVVQSGEFKSDQMGYPRVRDAYEQKLDIVKTYFARSGVDYPPEEVFIRIFKMENDVEVWAKDKNDDKFKSIITYKIAYLSGELGPKRRNGDKQVPEGIYHISEFNPNSRYLLSVRINYPNQSDRILGYKPNLGGDIFIHGSNVSIGCIPITHDCIRELYIILVDAKDNSGGEIPVHIFPFSFNRWEVKDYIEEDLKTFWNSLKPVYQYFEDNQLLPNVHVDSNGYYFIE